MSEMNISTGAPEDTAQAKNSVINIGPVDRVFSTVTGGALVAYGLRRRTPMGVGLAILGSNMVRWGVTGHSGVYDKLNINTAGGRAAVEARPYKVNASAAVTIDRPIDDLYRFWRDLGNMPRVMDFVKSVTPYDDRHWHWAVQTPVGPTVEFDVESTPDDENKRISWHSVGTGKFTITGTASFREAPAGRGTEVRLDIEITPPFPAAAAFAKLSGIPRRRVEGALRKFKELMEAGEVPTTHGQPSGQRSWKGKMMQRMEG